MANDVYPILGRTKRLPHVPRIGVGAGGLTSTPGVTPESYEFFQPDGDDLDSMVFPAYILSNSSLLSWLGRGRGNLVPLEDLDLLRAHTDGFIKWLDQGTPTYSKLEGPDDELVFSKRYVDGFYGSWLFPLQTIRDFEYDRIALVYGEYVEVINPGTGLTELIREIKPHPEFRTYESLFAGSGWLEFLDVAITQDWDFLIVVFD